MSRLSEIFSRNKKCFIPFITAGYPDLKTSEEIILCLAGLGAQIIEIGIPFSDPVADGPIIQKASFEALKQGYGVNDYIEMVSRLRRKTEAGLIFMTYCNPVFQYGFDQLDVEAAEAGLDGILVSDLTPEEYRRIGKFKNLDTIFLAAPTSSDYRLSMICEASSGFLYLIARTGVTGSKTDVNATVPAMMKRIRKFSDIPVAAGFGIATAEDVKKIWQHADGAIVGSAITRFMQDNIAEKNLPEMVRDFVKDTLLP